MFLKKIISIGILTFALSSCASNVNRDPEKPITPTWFITTSPSGQKIECMWVAEYGSGGNSGSYQAGLQCWEIK
jgi:hypothetical protein